MCRVNICYAGYRTHTYTHGRNECFRLGARASSQKPHGDMQGGHVGESWGLGAGGGMKYNV